MRPNRIAYEKNYGDDSGVEFSVRLEDDEIIFEAINETCFPIEQLDWLIKALTEIKTIGFKI